MGQGIWSSIIKDLLKRGQFHEQHTLTQNRKLKNSIGKMALTILFRSNAMAARRHSSVAQRNASFPNLGYQMLTLED